jgi:hypothetical protein
MKEYNGIELLQAIKRGEIKDGTEFKCKYYPNYGQGVIYKSAELVWLDNRELILTGNLLDDGFVMIPIDEIVEEHKPIERLDTWFSCEDNFNNSRQYINSNAKQCYEKINEIIDYLAKENEE